MYRLPEVFPRLSAALFALAAALVLAGAPTVRAADSAAPQQLIDRIVAVVNDGVITQRQLDDKTAEVGQQLQAAGNTLPDRTTLERQVLDRMIIDKLQLETAKRMGIHIDDMTLNDTLNTIAGNNNLTLKQLRERVVASGQPWAQFVAGIRDRLTIQKLEQREVTDRVHITHQEVRDFLAQHANQIDPGVEYHLAQILIPIPGAADPKQVESALNKAEAIRKQAESGTPFSKLAISDSAGQNALKGGDLGWMTADQMPTYFVHTVNVLHLDEVSQPIRSPSGYHLVKLLATRGGKQQKVTEYKVRQILLTPNATLSSAAAKAKLERLRHEIESGASFAKLAQANSMDPGSAADGGDLGWLNPAELVPAFTKVMKTLKVNQLSQPFHSPFGWHLIQVMGIREVDNTEQMVRAQAQNILFQRKRAEALNIWLRRLRDEAYVDIRLPGATADKTQGAAAS